MSFRTPLKEDVATFHFISFHSISLRYECPNDYLCCVAMPQRLLPHQFSQIPPKPRLASFRQSNLLLAQDTYSMKPSLRKCRSISNKDKQTHNFFCPFTLPSACPAQQRPSHDLVQQWPQHSYSQAQVNAPYAPVEYLLLQQGHTTTDVHPKHSSDSLYSST